MRKVESPAWVTKPKYLYFGEVSTQAKQQRLFLLCYFSNHGSVDTVPFEAHFIKTKQNNESK